MNCTVDASRFSGGVHNPDSDKREGQGDINASYSADTIAFAGKVRRPFHHTGDIWVCVNAAGKVPQAECYRLTHQKLFTDKASTYQEKGSSPDHFTDPLGPYHGIVVRSGKETYVLVGPPVTFVAEAIHERAEMADESDQLDLFNPQPEPV